MSKDLISKALKRYSRYVGWLSFPTWEGQFAEANGLVYEKLWCIWCPTKAGQCSRRILARLVRWCSPHIAICGFWQWMSWTCRTLWSPERQAGSIKVAGPVFPILFVRRDDSKPTKTDPSSQHFVRTSMLPLHTQLVRERGRPFRLKSDSFAPNSLVGKDARCFLDFHHWLQISTDWSSRIGFHSLYLGST